MQARPELPHLKRQNSLLIINYLEVAHDTNLVYLIMKKLKIFSFLFFVAIMSAMLTGCSKDDDDDTANKQHDASLFGEWVANDGRKYVHDYYSFYSDGTGIHGSYESDIDWVNEDDDIKWYTVDNKYLYIDGTKYSYSCDGSSLRIGNKTYYEK